jgi:tetratricopeptide (TPR) repeat protein
MTVHYRKLYIYTLGNFLVRGEHEVLFSGKNKYLNKRWRLFLHLLFNKGNKVTDKELIRELDLEENVEPHQSLRALVYRLRKDLRFTDSKFILSDQGGYVFNPQSHFWLDTEYFSGMIEKAKEVKEKHSSLNFYQEAVNLYKGKFLENQQLTNVKINKLREKYQELHKEAVTQAGMILLEQKNHEKAIDVYEEALQLNPLCVDFYTGLIESYKKAGRPDLALMKTEEAMLYLKNTKLPMPENLNTEINNFFQTDISENPADILENNKLCRGETFECGPMTFSSIYSLEKRRSKREDKNIYLVHIKINGTPSPEKLTKAEKILRNTINNSLRENDVVTRWKPRYYLILLVDIASKVVDKILKRIRNVYNGNFPPAETSISYSYQKI